MKKEYLEIITSLLGAGLAIPVMEYSIFLSGVLLGAAGMRLIITTYRLLTAKRA